MRPDDWCVNPTTFYSSEPDVTYSKDKIIILLILYNARWLVFKPSAFCSSEPDATHSTVKLKFTSFSVSDVAHNDDLQSLFLYTPSDWTNQYWWKIHHWTIHQQKVYHTILHSQEVHHRPVHHQTNRTPTSFTTSGASLYYHVVFFVITHTHTCTNIHTYKHAHTYKDSQPGWLIFNVNADFHHRAVHCHAETHSLPAERACVAVWYSSNHTHTATHPHVHTPTQIHTLDGSFLSMVTGWHQWWTVLFCSFFWWLVVWWWVVHTPEQTVLNTPHHQLLEGRGQRCEGQGFEPRTWSSDRTPSWWPADTVGWRRKCGRDGSQRNGTVCRVSCTSCTGSIRQFCLHVHEHTHMVNSNNITWEMSHMVPVQIVI